MAGRGDTGAAARVSPVQNFVLRRGGEREQSWCYYNYYYHIALCSTAERPGAGD